MAYRPNDTYNSIREQLERETQGLISLQQPSAPYVSQGRVSYPLQSHKKNDLKNKIREIIDLCKDENASVTKDIAGVAEAEKGICGLLQQADLQPAVSGQSGQFTPIRQLPDNNTSTNLQKDIRNLISNSRVKLSQEAVNLINEIERRWLSEIQKLREEKLSLINQLNDEIRRHNAEKKRCAELERQLEFYRKQNPSGNARYENQLRERVNYLEGLIQLQSKQGFKGDLSDIQALFAQGEALRQETLRLLRMKEAKGYSDDVEKRRLRDEVENLQRKVDQLEAERTRPGKPSYQGLNQYSPISKNIKAKDSYRNSANQYQSLVMEIKKITQSR